jgi:hypothetical protein
LTVKEGGTSDSEFSASTDAVPPIPPSSRTPPTVTGTARDGQMLRASRGEWDGIPPPDFAYQWERCGATGCQAIFGAASVEYVAVGADVGMTLQVCVTATNVGGTAAACSGRTGVIAPSPLVNLALPEIAGRPEVGASLSARPGRWSISGVDLLYRWLRCDADGSACASVPGQSTPPTRYDRLTSDSGCACA